MHVPKYPYKQTNPFWLANKLSFHIFLNLYTYKIDIHIRME